MGKEYALLIFFAPDAVYFFFFEAHQAQTADFKLLIRSMAHRLNFHEAWIKHKIKAVCYSKVLTFKLWVCMIAKQVREAYEFM